MRKLICPPGAEVLGQNISAFSDNLQGEYLEKIMRKHDLVDLDPEGWYPLQNLMDALNEIAENGNNMSSSFVAIGKRIGEILPMPPGMENATLVQVLEMWDDLYQYLHRNADVGEVRLEKVTDKHYKTIHSNLYPDDMSYGLLYAYGRRFLPRGTHFKVYYDSDEPARDHGGGSKYTIIHTEWE